MKKSEIIQAIKTKLGITALNDMQRAVIDCESPDVLLHSPTGSGKTVAFASLVLLRANLQPNAVGAVVVAPSRELVIQIADVVRRLAVGIKTVALYGGHSMEVERKQLEPTPQIIIATPGRLVDHV
ncbi:MAG: DEAD/DEAH box helicase, partial [Muribaculaceae bacterium]|nr:DEAD/DEAH box helicase [Muribaculaceae bacterium]